MAQLASVPLAHAGHDRLMWMFPKRRDIEHPAWLPAEAYKSFVGWVPVERAAREGSRRAPGLPDESALWGTWYSREAGQLQTFLGGEQM